MMKRPTSSSLITNTMTNNSQSRCCLLQCSRLISAQNLAVLAVFSTNAAPYLFAIDIAAADATMRSYGNVRAHRDAVTI